MAAGVEEFLGDGISDKSIYILPCFIGSAGLHRGLHFQACLPV